MNKDEYRIISCVSNRVQHFLLLPSLTMADASNTKTIDAERLGILSLRTPTRLAGLQTGNAISWFLVERASRRPLTFYGICSLTVDLILTDALAVVATPTALKGKSKFLHKYRLNIGSFHRNVWPYPSIPLGIQRHN